MFLKDPLLHFSALGAALFALFLLTNERAPDDDTVVISQARQAQLAAAFGRVWRRPPSDEELKGLIDEWLREELANREAVAMGLARDDLIIRRRLRQKYEAFMDQVASAVEPTETELRVWYDDHADDYRTSMRVTFTQVFFSTDRRDTPAAFTFEI